MIGTRYKNNTYQRRPVTSSLFSVNRTFSIVLWELILPVPLTIQYTRHRLFKGKSYTAVFVYFPVERIHSEVVLDFSNVLFLGISAVYTLTFSVKMHLLYFENNINFIGFKTSSVKFNDISSHSSKNKVSIFLWRAIRHSTSDRSHTEWPTIVLEDFLTKIRWSYYSALFSLEVIIKENAAKKYC